MQGQQSDYAKLQNHWYIIGKLPMVQIIGKFSSKITIWIVRQSTILVIHEYSQTITIVSMIMVIQHFDSREVKTVQE